MNFATFVVMSPTFYCQLPAVGFPGLMPKVFSRALTELRKDHGDQWQGRDWLTMSHSGTEVRKQKSRTESTRENSDSGGLKKWELRKSPGIQVLSSHW